VDRGYNPQNEEEILSALREIMQEITLAALSRTDFFEKAAFMEELRSEFFMDWIDIPKIWIFLYLNLILDFQLSPILKQYWMNLSLWA
jgi:hypothetical protein